MALFLRPTGLSSAAYQDQADYIVTEDGRSIGRMYEDRQTKPGLGMLDGALMISVCPLPAKADMRLSERTPLLDPEPT